MPFIYPNPRSLIGQPKAGNGECIELIKQNVPGLKGLPTSAWCQGENVIDSGARIAPGTAIATFEHGRYPNRPHGNHAAIVLQVMASGIWVLDQWKHDNIRKTIDRRLIVVPPRWRQRDEHGSLLRPSDNALAFFVIERC